MHAQQTVASSDDTVDLDRQCYLETLEGIKLLQRFIRRRRWQKLFGAKHIPLIHGPCGMVAWPIFQRTQLVGMEGPSGRQYRSAAFGCVPVDHPVRVGAIFLLEWPWFDRLSLLFVTANCVTLALQGPPGSHEFLGEARLRDIELTFSIIFTAELLCRVLAMGFWGHEHTYLGREAGWNKLDLLSELLTAALKAFTLFALPSFHTLIVIESRVPQ